MMKVALIVGHSIKSQGAINKRSRITEFIYNTFLANIIKSELSDSEVNCVIVYRSIYRELPVKINGINPDITISLHCNSYNSKVSGSETLYYKSSEDSKNLAIKMQKTLVKSLQLKDRGIKPKVTKDRGGYLLRYVNSPCVILEPFFIDNNSDLKIGQERISQLASNIARAIKEFGDGS